MSSDKALHGAAAIAVPYQNSRNICRKKAQETQKQLEFFYAFCASSRLTLLIDFVFCLPLCEIGLSSYANFIIVKGDLHSPTATRLVREWVDLHTQDLPEDWDLAREGKELKKIDPLS